MADENKWRPHVEFFLEPVQDKRESKKEGRPIYKEREMVKMMFPGDNKRTLIAPANERFIRNRDDNQWVTYAEAYPDHYEAFKKGIEYHGDGTPLSELPFISAAKRKELQAINIHTAEQLAALDGTPLQKAGMGARELKNQAQAWLDKAKDSALETRLAAENVALRDQLASLQEQVSGLVAGNASRGKLVEPETKQPQSESPFADWEDESLKTFIKERSGETLRGNFNQDTLVAKADAIIAAENEKDKEAEAA